MKLTRDDLLTYGMAAAAAFVAYKFATRSASDFGKDIGGGIVGAVSGVIKGGYEAMPEAIKPDSQKNIIYRGVNGIGSTITGDKKFTLGGWIYDVTH